LGKIGGKEIASSIIELLNEDKETAQNAVVALGMIGSDRSILR
jgi:hypothetical protein